MIPIQPDCDNCEYQDEDGRCTAYDESTSFDPLPGEEQEGKKEVNVDDLIYLLDTVSDNSNLSDDLCDEDQIWRERYERYFRKEENNVSSGNILQNGGKKC